MPATPAATLDAARTQRVPDFFIVGAPKTGTTSLYLMLRKHPQIFMSELKEPQYLERGPLASPDRASRADRASRGQGESSGRGEGESSGREDECPATLEDYLALFQDAAPEQLAGEATSTYLVSHSAADHIADLQPRARIIAILREPASFLRSFHLQCLKVGLEDEKDLRTAISLEADRREGRRVPRGARRPALLQYSEHLRYVEQLERYRARFPAEQMLVLIYDDFQADYRGTMRGVLRFLGVDDTHPIPVRKANQSVSVRSRRMQALVGAIGGSEGRLTSAVKTLAPRRVRYRSYLLRRRLVFKQPPAPDEGLMLELRRRFKPEVVALSEHLGRDLVSLWGYDELG